MDAPEQFLISNLFKATPKAEGGARIVYIEPSNETLDAAGEKVLSSALAAAAAEYERFGNLDVDHYTIIGPKIGLRDYMLYEIGRPLQVRIDGRHTFVKAQLYQGDGETARQANLVWESMTQLSPPARWYPSVGGAVLEKAAEIDPENNARVTLVKRVRWTNIAFSRTPVNQAVPSVATVPFGVFAKCWTPGGLDLGKALEAGQTYAIADAPGGQALRQQSLDHRLQRYWDYGEWRDDFATRIRDGTIKINAKPAALIEALSEKYGLNADQAFDYLERFFRDAQNQRK